MERTEEPPPRDPRTFEHVCERIRARLAAGELRAGDKLPPERDMAETYRVGRNAVREALRTLEMAGVVRLEKGRAGGAYICPAGPGRVTVVIRDLMNFGSLSLQEVAESRTVMMDAVTRIVCEHITAADLEELATIVDDIERHTEAIQLEQRADGIARFYARLVAITCNRVLMMMATALSEIVRRFLDSAALRGRPMESLVPAFRRYLDLLRARDRDNACAELRQHLLSTHSHILRAVERVAGVAGVATTTELEVRPIAEVKPGTVRMRV